MIVAIDGPAGVGKSTVASHVAEKFGFFNLNSGNFYRAVALRALEEQISPENQEALTSLAKKMKLDIVEGRLTLDGVDVEDKLHTDSVDRVVSPVSACVPVRHIVNDHIRRITAGMNVVAEGRDMTSVVFPQGELKFFLDATPLARAKRRYRQGVSELSLEEIRRSIEERDLKDRNKKEGSLKITEDATYLDTSDLTLDQVCERVSGKIKEYSDPGERPIMADKDVMAADTQTKLQEAYMKPLESLEEGSTVEGTVVQVDAEFVYLDVFCKCEGKLSLSEFSETPALNDKVSVLLIKKEGRNGEPIISKKKAEQKQIWKELKDAFNDKTPVDGEIVKEIKGGFEVELGVDARAFLPISKTDIVKVENPSEYIGLKGKFLLERLYGERKVNIVVSRRGFLEKASLENRVKFFETTKEGDMVTGSVKSFTSFGAFIDLGGFDGLLHINDMSWGHVTRPRDFVKKGQEITLKVIKLDAEGQKINLSLKDFLDDPWESFNERYALDDRVKGTVTKLTDFGAFIEIEPGIEGLAHISELSWVKKIKHPKEILNIGDEVETMILGYDMDERRVSLGLKQVLPNPWDDIEADYPVGTKLTRVIKNVTNAGAFVELEEGIDGFLHVDDYSWTQKVPSAHGVFKPGDEIEVTVIRVDTEARRIRLGVKQLTEDPWEQLKNTYPKGSIIEGEVSNVADFGVFVKVPGDIEGLIFKNQLSPDREADPDDMLSQFKVGDKVRAAVSEINPGRQKLGLSIRELKYREERQEIERYMDSGNASEAGMETFTLADALKKED